MLLSVEYNESPHPVDVGLFGFPGVACITHMSAYLIQKAYRFPEYAWANVVHGRVPLYCICVQYNIFPAFQAGFQREGVRFTEVVSATDGYFIGIGKS